MEKEEPQNKRDDKGEHCYEHQCAMMLDEELGGTNISRELGGQGGRAYSRIVGG